MLYYGYSVGTATEVHLHILLYDLYVCFHYVNSIKCVNKVEFYLFDLT